MLLRRYKDRNDKQVKTPVVEKPPVEKPAKPTKKK